MVAEYATEQSDLTLAPLSLYLHFPWCVRKCPYCDFNSHSLGQDFDQEQYIDALIADLDYELSELNIDRPLISIFMGGGTPSLFSPDAMHRLIEFVSSRLTLTDDIEITMEANPGTTEHYEFNQYRRAGINRLSLGVQSFDPVQLTALGRIHSSDDAITAFGKARTGGFDNINIDLMFGLPGQTTEAAAKDLSTAISMTPEHISLYQLTLEPNTVFYRYPPPLPGHDYIVEMQQMLQQNLISAGFRQYEVSAYAKNYGRCKHNMNYWQYGDYLGIGAGAHGKITTAGKTIRRARKKHPGTYLGLAGSHSAIAESVNVEEKDLLFEFLMNALRLREGFHISSAIQRTGLQEDQIIGPLRTFIENGFLIRQQEQLRCSEKGYLFLDHILQSLL
jgi:oxygen-independent coproporphyrinogen-3 oxidase